MQKVLENLTESEIHTYDSEIGHLIPAISRAVGTRNFVVVTSGGTSVELTKDGYEIGNFSTGNRGARMAE